MFEHFLQSAGYLAVFAFGFLEACCIPIPSEITFGFAGVLAAQGKLSLVLIIILGTFAELAGSLISYAVGRKAGVRTIERYGKWMLLTKSDVRRAERFLAGRGMWAVAVGRILPIVRSFAAVAAGLIEVPAKAFVFLSFIGTLVYACIITLIGYNLGGEWTKLTHTYNSVTIVVIAILVVAAVAHRVHALRKERRQEAAEQLAYAEQPVENEPAAVSSQRESRPRGAHRSRD